MADKKVIVKSYRYKKLLKKAEKFERIVGLITKSDLETNHVMRVGETNTLLSDVMTVVDSND